MMVIMETRCDPKKLKRTFNLLGYDGFLATDTDGYSRGIVVVWKINKFMVQLVDKKFQFLHLKVNLPNSRVWYFSAVYASPQEVNRSALWHDLKIIAASMNEPWLLAGYFNDILGPHEKKGGASVCMRKCIKFKEHIDDCKLMDLGAVGSKFTWRGPLYRGGQHIYERLDRALSNDLWRVEFPDGFVRTLPRLDFSDHHPILVCPIEALHVMAPKQFRFESAWPMENSYYDMLKDSWETNGSIVNNLKSVERGIKSWKFSHFDKVRHKKRELEARLGGIQRRIHLGRHSRGLIVLENKLQHELNIILKKEELMWFQRSRARWLMDGDRNTKYYHVKTIARRRKNNVIMLRDAAGQWVEDVDHVKVMVNDFYKNLFALENAQCVWQQSEVPFPELANDYIVKLGAPVSDEEIKKAMFNTNPWKAPGPDGFPAGVFQKSWEVVGKNVCDFVREVWLNPSHIATVNQTDICLLPKVQQPEFVNQFRPISLCNTIYKVVSKTIVDRLKEAIPFIISPFQTGFVPGRNIHENIVVAQEMIHSMIKMKGRKRFFAIKVDLSKAYDKLSWEFIWCILTELKLPDNIVNLIMHSVTSVETNVKWNGARTEYFRPQRGIRQGDLISPYLFVMCIDKLSHLISHAVETREWKALRAKRRGPIVSHLMFVDDMLIFSEATEVQMRCIISIVEKFCSLSGQEVSQEKTSIFFSKNTSRCVKDKLLQLSGYRESNSLEKYLGVPLLGKAPKTEDYNYIIDQVSMKLASWKANHLSFAGRVTLAKSVMEAIPIYPMMTTIIPRSCVDEIQRMQRRFIWGDTDEKRRYHSVGWDALTKPKISGGLGFRRLNVLNKACILKLWRKLQTGSQDLWCSVLWGKYRREADQNSVIARSTDSHL